MKKQKRKYQWHGEGMKEAVTKYHAQKDGAKRRNIEWQFTFDEWIKWWKDHLGPDWLKLRGCTRGKYQMARYQDKGPYAPWNVDCVTTEANLKAKPPGYNRPKLTTAQLLLIEKLYSSGMTVGSIAARTGIKRGTVHYHLIYKR